MRFSNDGIFDTETLEATAATKSWTLDGRRRRQEVNAEYRDAARQRARYSATRSPSTPPPRAARSRSTAVRPTRPRPTSRLNSDVHRRDRDALLQRRRLRHRDLRGLLGHQGLDARGRRRRRRPSMPSTATRPATCSPQATRSRSTPPPRPARWRSTAVRPTRPSPNVTLELGCAPARPRCASPTTASSTPRPSRPYSATKAWTLSAADGTKTVWMPSTETRPVTCSPSRDTITLDTAAPSGTIAINGGAAYATSPNVTLNSDVTGATEMRFSNDGVPGHRDLGGLRAPPSPGR